MEVTLCRDCGRELIPHWTWSKLSRTARDALLPSHGRRASRGLCSRCEARHRDAGTLDDFERLRLTHQDVMEEYTMLSRSEGFTDQQIADRLGIHRSTLRRHLNKETHV